MSKVMGVMVSLAAMSLVMVAQARPVLKFNGLATNFSYVDMGAGNFHGLEDLTVEVWVKTSVKPVTSSNGKTYGAIVGQGYLGGGDPGFGLFVNGTDELVAFQLRQGGAYQIAAPFAFDGQWRHLAGVRAGGEIRLYVDGELKAIMESATGVQNSIANFGLGARHAGTAWGFPFNGAIAEVRLWNRARSTAEIAYEWHRRLFGNEPGLIGYWPLDEGEGTQVFDATAGSANGTVVSGTWDMDDDLLIRRLQLANPTTESLRFTNTNVVDVYSVLFPVKYSHYQVTFGDDVELLGDNGWVSTNVALKEIVFPQPVADAELTAYLWFTNLTEEVVLAKVEGSIFYTTQVPQVEVQPTLKRHVAVGHTVGVVTLADVDAGSNGGMADGREMALLNRYIEAEGDITPESEFITFAEEGVYEVVLVAVNEAGNSAAATCMVSVVAEHYATWAKRMPITFSGYMPPEGGGPLTNFPALVVLRESEAGAGFSYSDFLSPPYGDLRFTAADKVTPLDFEVESWNVDGVSHVWVKVPELTAETTIYALWGKAGFGVPDCTINGAVWSEGFAAVWHMDDADTGAQDSTENRNHALTTTDVTGADGIVNGAGSFNGSTSAINIGNNSVLEPDHITFSAWVKVMGSGTYNDGNYIITKGRQGSGVNFAYAIQHKNEDKKIRVFLSGTSLSGNIVVDVDDPFIHVTGTYDQKSLKLYLNGVEKASTARTAAINYEQSNRDLHIGDWGYGGWTRRFEGAIDEVRISSTARSAEWVWAEWMNQAANTLFNNYGVPLQQHLPTVATKEVISVLPEGAMVSGTLFATGTSVTAVSVYWGRDDGGGENDVWEGSGLVGSGMTPGDFSTGISGLAAGTNYYARFTGVNESGEMWSTEALYFITGDVWLESVSDASKVDMMPGTVMVHRVASAVAEPLEVNYSVGGTAIPDDDYVALSGKVIIPAGETSAVIEIEPLLNHNAAGIATVSLTLASGPYVMGTESRAVVAIPALAVSAVGGVAHEDGIYRSHTFTESGTFSVITAGAVEVLVVGGGGGGGGSIVGGGGGGGGVIVTSMLVTPGEYEVVVGSGGVGGMGYNQPYQAGKQGGNSLFGAELIAIGGGGGAGGANTEPYATSGGSGGGGNALNPAAEGTLGQGHSGAIGSSASSNRSGGGGGGAGEPGGEGLAGVGGKGGDGILFYGSYYGGGGGGGLEKRSGVVSSSGGGEGGLGGGGDGSSGSLRAIDGAPNTGGGGGGAGYNGNVNAQLGGNGGSGVVIVRYKQQIINSGGAIEITTTTARLNGELVFTNTPNTEIAVFWGTEDGCGDVDDWDYSEQWQVQEAGAVFTNITGLLPDTTYYYCYAVITDDAVIWPLHSESFITGEVWLEKVSDASEIGLVPGTVMVHRAASVAAAALEINYSVEGTATPGLDYVALSGRVTIPAGETSAVVEIMPLFDRLIEGTETVVLTLESGKYAVGVDSQVVVEIEDRGRVLRVWSGAGKNALASNPANWFEGEVPTAVDGVALDGSSVKAMTWDIEYPVAVWRQTADYTGTVTFNTVYPGQGSFTNFVVTGDVELLGGVWTHPANSGGEVEVERLCVTVGGDFTVGANGVINVDNKGYARGTGPGAGNLSGSTAAYSASYGGSGANNLPGKGTYGSITKPENLGSGANNPGGGALKLRVAGTAVVDGLISAQGIKVYGNTSQSDGSGGSILIEAGSIAGSGQIVAGVARTYNSYYGSGGGRIALYSEREADFTTLNINTYGNNSTLKNHQGRAGTIYLQSPAGKFVVVDQGNVGIDMSFYTEIPGRYGEFATDPAFEGEFADVSLVVTNGGFAMLTRDVRFKDVVYVDGVLRLNSFTLYLKESEPSGAFPADFGGGVVEPSGAVYTFDDGTPVIRAGRIFWGDSNVTWRVVSLVTPTVGGTATFDGGETEGYYLPDSELTFTALAATGYNFVFWDGTVDSGIASEVNPLELAPISGNRVLRANFLDASLDPNLNVWLDVPFNRDWFDKRNWSLMAVPSAGQRVLLNAGSDVVIAGETAMLDEIVVRDSLLTLTAGGGQLRAGLVDISGSTLQFEAAAEGETTDSGEISRIDAGELVLELDTLKVVDGNHTLDLAGADITIGSFILQGFGEAVTGKFSVVNGGTIYVTDALTVGSGADCDAHLLLAADVGLELGSPEKRIELIVGYNQNGVYADAALTAGGKFSAWLNDFSVGRRTGGYSTGDNKGRLDLSAVTEPGVIDISGDVMIGWSRHGEGRVVVSDAIDVKIGSAEQRGGFLQIGSISNAGHDLESYLVLGSGKFEAYVTNLEVGAGQTDALLDASRVSAGVLDVAGHVRIAYKYNHYRSLLLSEGIRVKFGDREAPVEFVVAGESSAIAMIDAKSHTFEAYLTSLRLGQGEAVGTTAVLDLSSVTAGTLEIADELFYGADRNSTLSLVLGPGFVTKLGSEEKRATLTIGDGQRWLDMKLSARGSFEAWLESMVVGRRSPVTAGAEGYTIFDLSGVTNGLLDVAGDVLIGVGPEALGSDGKATVLLTSCSASAASLTVGAITNNNAYGHLIMTGSTFRVSGPVVVGPGKTDAEGVIQTTVNGSPCGLDMGEEAQLQVNNGRIEIDFDEPLLEHRGHYWGLRWAGDHVSELESLAAERKLVWDGTRLPRRVKIFSNRQFSFVGMEAPRSTLILLR